MISPLLASQLGEAAPEEVLCRPPREAWPVARVLSTLLMKMGRTGLQLSHAVGRRQASLGTPIPRTPTVAPVPKVRSGLASRQSQRSGTECRGPQKPVDLVDAWRLIGRGRLRFPTQPRQLPDLTGPCYMQEKDHYYLRSWRLAVGLPLNINGAGGRAPNPSSSSLCSLLLLPLRPAVLSKRPWRQ